MSFHTSTGLMWVWRWARPGAGGWPGSLGRFEVNGEGSGVHPLADARVCCMRSEFTLGRHKPEHPAPGRGDGLTDSEWRVHALCCKPHSLAPSACGYVAQSAGVGLKIDENGTHFVPPSHGARWRTGRWSAKKWTGKIRNAARPSRAEAAGPLSGMGYPCRSLKGGKSPCRMCHRPGRPPEEPFRRPGLSWPPCGAEFLNCPRLTADR